MTAANQSHPVGDQVQGVRPTSTQWQTAHDFDIEGRTTIIGNVDGEIIDGTTHYSYDFVARTLDEDDDSQSQAIAAENADFIVRACYSHASLIAALEGLVRDARPTNWDDDEDMEQWQAWLAADRAIAKARGQ